MSLCLLAYLVLSIAHSTLPAAHGIGPKFEAAEWIFVVSGSINGFVESFLETEGGPAFLNALVLMTLLRFGM